MLETAEKIEITSSSFQPPVGSTDSSNNPKTSTLKMSNSFSSNNSSGLYAAMTYSSIGSSSANLKRSQTMRSYPRTITPNSFAPPAYQQRGSSSFVANYSCVNPAGKFSTINDENELNECDEVNDSSLLFTPSTTSSSSSSSSPSAIYSNNQLLNGNF